MWLYYTRNYEPNIMRYERIVVYSGHSESLRPYRGLLINLLHFIYITAFLWHFISNRTNTSRIVAKHAINDGVLWLHHSVPWHQSSGIIDGHPRTISWGRNKRRCSGRDDGHGARSADASC